MSQFGPFHPGLHLHSYPPAVLIHVPPFKHGALTKHSFISVKRERSTLKPDTTRTKEGITLERF